MVYINVFPAQNTRLASGEEPISARCHLSAAILQRSVAQDALLVGRPGECSNQNDEWTTREWDGMGYSTPKNPSENSSLPGYPPGKCGIKHESNLTSWTKWFADGRMPRGEFQLDASPRTWSFVVDPFEKKPKNQTVLNRSEPLKFRIPHLYTSLWRKQTIIPVWYTNHHTHKLYLLWGNEPSFNILKLPVTNQLENLDPTRALEGFQCRLWGEVLQLLHVLPEHGDFFARRWWKKKVIIEVIIWVKL